MQIYIKKKKTDRIFVSKVQIILGNKIVFQLSNIWSLYQMVQMEHRAMVKCSILSILLDGLFSFFLSLTWVPIQKIPSKFNNK